MSFTSVLPNRCTVADERGKAQYQFTPTARRMSGFISPQLKQMHPNDREDLLNHGDYVVILPIEPPCPLCTTLWMRSKPGGRIAVFLMRTMSNFGRRGFKEYFSPLLVLAICRSDHPVPPKTGWSWDSLSFSPVAPSPVEWNAPRSPWDREDEAVLVYVDKTYQAKGNFLVRGRPFSGYIPLLTDPQENDRRLALLKGLVYYGHIAEEITTFSSMRIWNGIPVPNGKIRKINGKPLTNGSSLRQRSWSQCSISLSPPSQGGLSLQGGYWSSLWAQSAFPSWIFLDTYREDARAKFSYIADEYREIRQFDRVKPVNVYFVNTAITSGSTLIRARNLVTMLMAESEMPYDRESIFKGCFVFINRSAYDTLNSYVKTQNKLLLGLSSSGSSFFQQQARSLSNMRELTEQYRILRIVRQWTS